MTFVEVLKLVAAEFDLDGPSVALVSTILIGGLSHMCEMYVYIYIHIHIHTMAYSSYMCYDFVRGVSQRMHMLDCSRNMRR